MQRGNKSVNQNTKSRAYKEEHSTHHDVNLSNNNNNDSTHIKALELLSRYSKEYEKWIIQSIFFRNNPPNASSLPSFDTSDLGIGPILGLGGFCDVHEIISIISVPSSSSKSETKSEESKEIETSQFMHTNVFRDGSARYAIKHLRKDVLQQDDNNQDQDAKTTKRNKIAVVRGIYDLAMEAQYLASFSHPSILRLRGLANTNPLSSSGDYFLVLDRLYGTLQERIDGKWTREWKEEVVDVQKAQKGGFMGLFGGNKKKANDDTSEKKDWKEKQKEIFLERLTVAFDVANVMKYLHKQRLIYRDIKSENIGFDVRGDVKVFDFGLCKEKPRSKDSQNKNEALYKITGRTGSIPYMSPENALCQQYNEKTDVYSFAILLYELFELSLPFQGFNRTDYITKVCKGKYRPSVGSKDWPFLTKDLMKECWAHQCHDRPTFDRITSVLRGEMNDMNEEGRNSIRQRTTHLLNRSKNSTHLRSS